MNFAFPLGPLKCFAGSIIKVKILSEANGNGISVGKSSDISNSNGISLQNYYCGTKTCLLFLNKNKCVPVT